MSYRPPQDEQERRQLAEERRRAEERERLAAHRGMATWGETLVPLGDFHRAAEQSGRSLSETERAAQASSYLAPRADGVAVEGPFAKIVVFGGVYNNHYGLAALLDEAARRGAEAVYCLGDLGGFGPSPNRVRPLLDQGAVRLVQGNYEESLSGGAEDCNCGYADPRDNHFAALSYRYTAENTAADFKRWMGEQPRRRRVSVGGEELLLVHGSPRRINEFLFASTAPVPFLEVLVEQEGCDGMLCTHTGLHWHRRLPSGRQAANVGVIGRPANDGTTGVWFAEVTARPDSAGSGAQIELVPLVYDHQGLAAEMRREQLPEEFVETILTGWWTTCLEVLPPRERALSKY
jgi:hypothetical protein